MIKTIDNFVLAAFLISYCVRSFFDHAEKQFGLDLSGMPGIANLQAKPVFVNPYAYLAVRIILPTLFQVSFILCMYIGDAVLGAVRFCAPIVERASIRVTEGLRHAARQFHWCIREINQFIKGIASFLFETMEITRLGATLMDLEGANAKKDVEIARLRAANADANAKKDAEITRLKATITKMDMENERLALAPMHTVNCENCAPHLVGVKTEAFHQGAVALKDLVLNHM